MSIHCNVSHCKNIIDKDTQWHCEIEDKFVCEDCFFNCDACLLGGCDDCCISCAYCGRYYCKNCMPKHLITISEEDFACIDCIKKL